jgi:lipopolysaccharide/colanic/teichoic acid biosynthesis glycosyltransferase
MFDDNRSVKRACDLLFGGFGLVVLFPVLIAIAVLLIGCGFHNPIFVQKRVGRDGRIFVIFKFRTLRDRTCRPLSARGMRYAKRLSAILRITGLDELPQLINVLRGEMSLVGPRPHSLADHHRFAERVPGYTDRLIIKPGMTGWAQIHGWRGPVCSDDHLQARITCDLDYISRQTLLFDCAILARTVALPLQTLARNRSRRQPRQACRGPRPCLCRDRRLV